MTRYRFWKSQTFPTARYSSLGSSFPPSAFLSDTLSSFPGGTWQKSKDCALFYPPVFFKARKRNLLDARMGPATGRKDLQLFPRGLAATHQSFMERVLMT